VEAVTDVPMSDEKGVETIEMATEVMTMSDEKAPEEQAVPVVENTIEVTQAAVSTVAVTTAKPTEEPGLVDELIDALVPADDDDDDDASSEEEAREEEIKKGDEDNVGKIYRLY
jgi:hypothetical protein